MTRSFLAVLALMVAILITAPAMAATITAEDASSYSVDAPDGMVIYKIAIDNLPIGTDQTHVLIYQGQPYHLTIETWEDPNWIVQKNAKITWQMPNGTEQTSYASTISIVGSYKTTIQPVMRADSSLLQSGTSHLIKVDLQIGLNPVSSNFNALPIIGYNAQSALPFDASSGSWTGGETSDVYVYVVTAQEFVDTIQNYNPAAGLGDLGAAIFQWTWSAVLGFINMIPVIGPLAVQFIDITGIVLDELIFWLFFIIENLAAILVTLEALLVMGAVINSGSGPRAFGRFCKNVVNYNAAIFWGFVSLFNLAKAIVFGIIDVVSKIVSALKPI